MNDEARYFDQLFLSNNQYWKFLSVFIREMDACLHNLDTAIRQSDVKAARSELHQMLGSSKIIGDVRFEKLVSQVRTLVIDGDLDQSKQLITELRQHLDAFFNNLVQTKREIHVGVIHQSATIIQLIQDDLGGIDQFSVDYVQSPEEAVTSGMLFQIDILLVQNDQPLIADVLKQFKSKISIPPILLIQTVSGNGTGQNLPNVNICGKMIPGAPKAKWIEAIVTQVNGREYHE